MTVWIDGTEVSDGTISVHDLTLLRGDGCFEAIRSYAGRGFAVDDHLERLDRSARALELEVPGRADLRDWIDAAAHSAGDAVIRVVVTRGDGRTSGRVIVLAEDLPVVPTVFRLAIVEAPWHPAGRPWDLSGVKSVSYAPNVAATRTARRVGADDALLASEKWLLEGPTFSVGWIVGDRLETPSLDLGILESVTRRHVIGIAEHLGIEVDEVRCPPSRLNDASEVMVWSTIREVRPVVAVDELSFDAGPVTGRLAEAFQAAVRR